MIGRRLTQAIGNSCFENDSDSDVVLAGLLQGDTELIARFVEENRQRVFSFVYSILMNKEDAEDVTQETFIRALSRIETFQGESSLVTWVLRIGRNAALDLKRKRAREKRLTSGSALIREQSLLNPNLTGSNSVTKDSQLGGSTSSRLDSKGSISVGDYGGAGAIRAQSPKSEEIDSDFARGELSSAGSFSTNGEFAEPMASGSCPAELLQIKEQVSILNLILSEMSRDHREVLLLREVDGLSYDEIAEVVGVSQGTVMSRLFYARKRVQQALEALEHADENEVARLSGADYSSEFSENGVFGDTTVQNQSGRFLRSIVGSNKQANNREVAAQSNTDGSNLSNAKGAGLKANKGRFSFGRFAGLGLF